MIGELVAPRMSPSNVYLNYYHKSTAIFHICIPDSNLEKGLNVRRPSTRQFRLSFLESPQRTLNLCLIRMTNLDYLHAVKLHVIPRLMGASFTLIRRPPLALDSMAPVRVPPTHLAQKLDDQSPLRTTFYSYQWRNWQHTILGSIRPPCTRRSPRATQYISKTNNIRSPCYEMA